MRSLLFTIAFLLAGAGAHAKSATWWDCFFREFENCSGGTAEADAKGGVKGMCDSKARQTCDEEERANELKNSGVNSNTISKYKGSTIQLNSPEAKPSKPGDALSSPGSAFVEGKAPSGDKTVLGVDITLSISQMADAYKARNIHGCRSIEDAYTRFLCLDAPGAADGVPIELEFYKGRLMSLSFAPKPDGPVKFRAAVTVAEEKTGAKAYLTSMVPDRELAQEAPSRFCEARFPLGGGTLSIQGLPPEPKDDPCAPAAADAAALTHVGWVPSAAVQHEIAVQRKTERPSAPPPKEDLSGTKALLPL